MNREITLTVNGETLTHSVPVRMNLVDFLRHEAGLTGSHVGCEHGVCGACTLMVDGATVRGCLMLAVQADGAEVTTIEGMANADGSLNTIQQAFQDHHGLQCGFCTPGMVMSVAKLLEDNPKPSEHEIREYLEGNICRCTGYHNIVKAVLAASGQQMPAIAAE